VTTLALSMKGILQIRPVGLRPVRMTFLAFFYRVSLAPVIAAAVIFMMAGGAGNALLLVLLVAEGYRRLLPGLQAWALNKTLGLGLGGQTGLGPDHPQITYEK